MAAPHIDDDWSVDAVEATTISLVRRTVKGKNEHGVEIYGPPEQIHTFHPSFLHDIFGENEQIFGYKGLDMEIHISEDSLFSHYKSSYETKFPKQGDTEADDVEAVWRNYVEAEAFDTDDAYAKKLKATALTHHMPPGHMIKATYVTEDERYEIWHGKLNDPRVFEAMAHIDFLNPLLIDGGSCITESPDAPTNENWTVFFIFKRKKNHITLVGYCTVWSLFYYVPPTPPASDSEDANPTLDLKTEVPDLKLPTTRRIAQFVILPPFQHQGLAQILYSGIYTHFRKDEETCRITVESPNSGFDDLRDICDLNFLRTLECHKNININTSYVPPKPFKGKESAEDVSAPKPAFEKGKVVSLKTLHGLLPQLKLAPRQFARIVEMHLMSQLPESVRPSLEPVKANTTPEDRHHYRLWSLLVKNRIARENVDALAELEREERIYKLDETLKNIGEDYSRILDKAERAAKFAEEREARCQKATNDAIKATGGKRKVHDDDDPAAKRVRTGDFHE